MARLLSPQLDTATLAVNASIIKIMSALISLHPDGVDGVVVGVVVSQVRSISTTVAEMRGHTVFWFAITSVVANELGAINANVASSTRSPVPTAKKLTVPSSRHRSAWSFNSDTKSAIA
jgi:hypothetical protein